jgi:hypothetical protein
MRLSESSGVGRARSTSSGPRAHSRGRRRRETNRCGACKTGAPQLAPSRPNATKSRREKAKSSRDFFPRLPVVMPAEWNSVRSHRARRPDEATAPRPESDQHPRARRGSLLVQATQLHTRPTHRRRAHRRPDHGARGQFSARGDAPRSETFVHGGAKLTAATAIDHAQTATGSNGLKRRRTDHTPAPLKHDADRNRARRLGHVSC